MKITLFFFILSQILARNLSEQILFAFIFLFVFFFFLKKEEKKIAKRKQFLI